MIIPINLHYIPTGFNLSTARDYYAHELKLVAYSKYAWKEIVLHGYSENMFISMSEPMLKWYEAQYPEGGWGFRTKPRSERIDGNPTIIVDFTTPDALLHRLTW